MSSNQLCVTFRDKAMHCRLRFAVATDSGVIDWVINCILHYGVKYYDTVVAIVVMIELSYSFCISTIVWGVEDY